MHRELGANTFIFILKGKRRPGHYQATAGDQVDGLHMELRARGFSCWYDNRMPWEFLLEFFPPPGRRVL